MDRGRGGSGPRGVGRSRKQKPKPPSHPVLTGFTQTQADRIRNQADNIREILAAIPASTRERGEQMVSAAENFDRVKNKFKQIAGVE